MKRLSITVVILISAALLVGCDLPDTKASAEDKMRVAQMELQKALFESQKADYDRVRALQLKVIETCVERGGIPNMQGGNVTCEQSPVKRERTKRGSLKGEYYEDTSTFTAPAQFFTGKGYVETKSIQP